MASSYVQAVRSRQSEGPYRLGGYCIGGGVAFEMARQLEAVGESVELLVLVDSVPQSHAEGRGVPGPTLLARRLRHLLSKEPKEMVASVGDAARKAVRGALKGAARRLGPAPSSTPAPAPSSDPSSGPDPSFPVSGGGNGSAPELDDVLDMRTLPRVYHEAARRHFRAMRDYRPGVFGGDAWLFRTRDARFAEDFGWGPFIGGRLGIEKVPGRHVDVLKEPHVRVVGEKLSAVLSGLAEPKRSDDGDVR
jgi:thioesterase domain-containing protein